MVGETGFEPATSCSQSSELLRKNNHFAVKAARFIGFLFSDLRNRCKGFCTPFSTESPRDNLPSGRDFDPSRMVWMGFDLASDPDRSAVIVVHPDGTLSVITAPST